MDWLAGYWPDFPRIGVAKIKRRTIGIARAILAE